jgi:hypothetical protein
MSTDIASRTYGFGTTIALPYEQTIERTRGVLKEQGFGVLTEINVKKTLKESGRRPASRSCSRRRPRREGSHHGYKRPAARGRLAGDVGVIRGDIWRWLRRHASPTVVMGSPMTRPACRRTKHWVISLRTLSRLRHDRRADRDKSPMRKGPFGPPEKSPSPLMAGQAPDVRWRCEAGRPARVKRWGDMR